jgi:hypothetical protein
MSLIILTSLLPSNALPLIPPAFSALYFRSRLVLSNVFAPYLRSWCVLLVFSSSLFSIRGCSFDLLCNLAFSFRSSGNVCQFNTESRSFRCGLPFFELLELLELLDDRLESLELLEQPLSFYFGNFFCAGYVLEHDIAGKITLVFTILIPSSASSPPPFPGPTFP